jgi:hypothetical protein
MSPRGLVFTALAVVALSPLDVVVESSTPAAIAQDAALRERAVAGLRKAVEFYRTQVATGGGYHFAYAQDLSYGRSEMSEGFERVEIQRDGTPIVALAYLEAYEATRDRSYLDAARDVALAHVRGQYCHGGWGYFIELIRSGARSTRIAWMDDAAGSHRRGPTGLRRSTTTSRRPRSAC